MVRSRRKKLLLSVALVAVVTVVALAAVMGTATPKASGARTARDSGSLYLYTTTSVGDSGLMTNVVLPAYNSRHPEITVVPAYVGSGAAIAAARKGDADVLVAHSPDAENLLVADGQATMRMPFAYNYFTLVGPKNDPAHVLTATSMKNAFARIAAWGKRLQAAGQTTRVAFVSRGDASGTNVKELAMWKAAGVTTSAGASPVGTWYITTGSGMGATLTIADQKLAYTLTDTATWYNMVAKPAPNAVADLRGLLIKAHWAKNQYSVLLINQVAHPLVNATAAEWLAAWLVSAQGQKAIGAYRQFGHQLYFPNAYTIGQQNLPTPTVTATP